MLPGYSNSNNTSKIQHNPKSHDNSFILCKKSVKSVFLLRCSLNFLAKQLWVLQCSPQSYIASGPIKVADKQNLFAVTDEYIKSVHFHIIQSSLNRESLNTSKNIIMRFLRLLLFLFVLLAPLQPTASHVGIKACSMGDRGACQSCCDKCLTNPEQFLDLHEPPTPAVCRHFCQRWNSCTIAH